MPISVSASMKYEGRFTFVNPDTPAALSGVYIIVLLGHLFVPIPAPQTVENE